MNVETAERLYKLRKKSGLSQEELADKLGVSRQAVSKWERAEASPDTDNLILLSKLYNVTLDELLNADNLEEEDLINSPEEESPIQEEVLEDKLEEKMERDVWPGIIYGSLTLLAVIAFLLVGLLTGLWHPYWVVFLLPLVVQSIFRAFTTKSVRKFAYAPLTVIIYILVSYYFNIWNIMWVVFITIPIFYIIANAIDNPEKIIKAKEKEPKVEEPEDIEI